MKAEYFTLGTYSISVLHYGLFYCDERGLVFERPVRVHKGLECEYYGYLEDYEILKKFLLKKTKDPKFVYEFSAQHQKDFKKLFDFIEKAIANIPADDKALADLFDEYWELLRISQPLGDCFITLDEVYMEGTKELVRKVLKKVGREEELDHIMIILSWPWKNFETLEEQIDFYKLAIEFQDYDLDSTPNEFRKNAPANLKKAFDMYMEDWCWIPHWYDNEPIDEQFLIDQLKKAKKKDVNEKYLELKNKTMDIKKEAEQLMAELEMSDELKEKIAELRCFTFFRTCLDLHTSRSLFKARPIYYEIAKRIGISFYELKFLTNNEVTAILRGEMDKSEAKKLYEERKELVVETYNMDKHTILVGKEAEDWVKEIQEKLDVNLEHKEEKTNLNLKGMAASPGVAEGPARVITSVEEVHSVLEGEILVVPATSIDFVVAMKKAIAVVTEVGGLTSHAAIVCRELGIPCVVNTKVATKNFKTGMKLKVLGSKGIVEVI